MEKQNDYKCYSCGKVFRDTRGIERHRNRKTPCLIRDVAEKDRTNPNRCMYCNIVFSKKSNMMRHLGVCKIKNGGMEILAEKVYHEHQSKAIKMLEKETISLREMCEKNKKFYEEKINQLLNHISNGAHLVESPTHNNTNINNTNNGTLIEGANYVGTINNNTNIDKSKTINFNMNCFTQPDTRNVHISADEVAAHDIPKLLMQKIYFDPTMPQNNSLYLLNKKDNMLIVYESSDWRLIVGVDGIDQFVHRLTNVVIPKGADIINGSNGPYEGKGIKFTELPGAIQAKIQEFNGLKQSIDRNAVYEVFMTNRSIVADNIRSSGCKLLK